jgi:glycosyltransferase involved in cell wall biosynthesis
MSGRRPRLLTIGHSYAVTLNRRLPNELARLSGWDVTAVGPARFRGDFGWHTLEPTPAEPCRVVPLQVHFSRWIHLMRYGRELSSLLAEPWDLVHCWEEPYIAAAYQVARHVPPEVPLVFATFQNIAKRYPPPFNWFERYSMNRADGVIAFGQTIADVLASKDRGRVSVRGAENRAPVPLRRAETRPRPVAVIPPGVDLGEFRLDEARRAATLTRLGWSDGPPVVGFLGRFVPEKGVQLLTSVLDRLKTPWRALLVGTGPLEGTLTAWGSRHGDRIRIVTTAQHDDVPAYLNAMDVLCAPSQTTARWREQFGRMLIEAFASGVAVIASTSGEIPYVVADAGLLLPEDDPSQWQQAIEKLTMDRARRCELARRGRARAEAVYGWPVVARQHLDFFERVIAGRAS